MKINFKAVKLTLYSAAFLTAFGCTKPEYGVTDTSQPNNNTEISQTIADIKVALNGAAPAIEKHMVSTASGKLIVGQKGTRITISPNSFATENGQGVSGDIDFELQEIFTVGEMIGAGIYTTSGDKYLVSGGELYINATQNGNKLKLAPGASLDIQVPAANPDPDMALFVGTGSPDENNFDWQPVTNPVQTCSDSVSQFFGYCFNVSELYNFINCDYFSSYPGPFTPVEMQVPATYNDTNTVVLLHIPSINSVARIYKYSNGSFWADGSYELPVGLNVNFVAVHKSSTGLMYYAYQNNTIVNGHTEPLSFQQVTVAQLQAFLSSL